MSDQIKHAFPSGEGQFAGGPNHDYGMTLRDYFAAQAMIGLSTMFNGNKDVAEGVRRAYLIADTMIHHRET